MGRTFGFAALAIVFAARMAAQIGGLSTTADGSQIYFTTDYTLRQRGSDQQFTPKVFRWQDQSITLVEDLWDQHPIAPADYVRTSVSGDGLTYVVNQRLRCPVGGVCNKILSLVNSARVHSANGVVLFAGNVDLTANGRFGALTSYVPPGIQLIDLANGSVSSGLQVGVNSHLIAEDGTILVEAINGAQLVGTSRSEPFAFPRWNAGRVVLSGDAKRIVYELGHSIRAFEIATGTDTGFGEGSLPSMAGDSRRFTFARGSQLWLGDAISGEARLLSEVADGILDQVLCWNGTKTILATTNGRLLSLDVGSGSVQQLLDSPGPITLIYSTGVPGSYNEVAGAFGSAAPELLIGKRKALPLGPTPRGYAFQIPWESQADKEGIILRGAEPAWERQQFQLTKVDPQLIPVAPVALFKGWRIDFSAADRAYAIHEDWSGLITEALPARPGEVIHFYATGLGAVDGAIATGEPAPPEPLIRTLAVACSNAEIVFSGLAPGLVGIYQLDLRIPPRWSDATFQPECTAGGFLLPMQIVDVQH